LFFLILITVSLQKSHSRKRCDLLSEFVLSNIDNSKERVFYYLDSVVICFQSLFFLILITVIAFVF